MKIKKTDAPHDVCIKLVDFASNYVSKMSKTNLNSYADSMRVYYKDASDYCKIASLVQDRDFKGAISAAYDMDTCPRDEIPQDVWDYITYHSKV
jgi:hypothetical protein